MKCFLRFYKQYFICQRSYPLFFEYLNIFNILYKMSAKMIFYLRIICSNLEVKYPKNKSLSLKTCVQRTLYCVAKYLIHGV